MVDQKEDENWGGDDEGDELNEDEEDAVEVVGVDEVEDRVLEEDEEGLGGEDLTE
jgi:hypothetical protein